VIQKSFFRIKTDLKFGPGLKYPVNVTRRENIFSRNIYGTRINNGAAAETVGWQMTLFTGAVVFLML